MPEFADGNKSLCVDTKFELAESVETRDALCWLDPTRANCGWARKTNRYNITLGEWEVAENKMPFLKHLLLLLTYSFLEDKVVWPPWPDCQPSCDVLSRLRFMKEQMPHNYLPVRGAFRILLIKT